MARSEFIFAGAPYSNSAPLVDKLMEVDSRVRVINDHPANLVSDLNAGRADVALIPVAHFFAHPELTRIEGLGVAADGLVQSVLLKCNVPIDQIKVVERDPASATSNALTGVLLKNHFNREVQMVDSGDVEHPDASVVIGDRALCSDPAPAGDIDLARAWKEMTGLPFVFAVWGIRKDFPETEAVTDIAHRAYAAGAAALEHIADRYVKQFAKSHAFWYDYLNNTIHYRLNERDIEGMELFKHYLLSSQS